MSQTLRVLRDLEPTTTNPEEFRPTGANPAFAVEFPASDPRPGWALVTVDVEVDDEFAEERGIASPITLRFLPAGEHVPLARRPVPEIRGKRIRVTHIPEGTASIEVEVSPWVRAVRPRTVTFRSINPATAASIMSSDLAMSTARGSTDPVSYTHLTLPTIA